MTRALAAEYEGGADVVPADAEDGEEDDDDDDDERRRQQGDGRDSDGDGGCHGIGPGGAGGPRLVGHNDEVGTGGVRRRGGEGRREGGQKRPKN